MRKPKQLSMLQLHREKVTGCRPRIKQFLRYNNQYVVAFGGKLSTFNNPYRGWRYFSLVGTRRYNGRRKRW